MDEDTAVLWVLRDVLGLTGTKFGCGLGLWGACTVHVNGVATRSCITPLQAVADANVNTIDLRIRAGIEQAALALSTNAKAS